MHLRAGEKLVATHSRLSALVSARALAKRDVAKRDAACLKSLC